MTRPLCPFFNCAAGTGVAGNGSCFLRGNPDDPECPNFYDEDAFLRAWNYIDLMKWIGGHDD